MEYIATTIVGKRCLDCSKKIKPGQKVKVTRVIDEETKLIKNEHRCVECDRKPDGRLVVHNNAVTHSDLFSLGNQRFGG